MLKFTNNVQNTCNTMEEVAVAPGACCCCSCCCCVSTSVNGNASSSMSLAQNGVGGSSSVKPSVTATAGK